MTNVVSDAEARRRLAAAYDVLIRAARRRARRLAGEQEQNETDGTRQLDGKRIPSAYSDVDRPERPVNAKVV